MNKINREKNKKQKSFIQSGYSVINVILTIIVVGLIIGIVYYLFIRDPKLEEADPENGEPFVSLTANQQENNLEIIKGDPVELRWTGLLIGNCSIPNLFENREGEGTKIVLSDRLFIGENNFIITCSVAVKEGQEPKTVSDGIRIMVMAVEPEVALIIDDLFVPDRAMVGDTISIEVVLKNETDQLLSETIRVLLDGDEVTTLGAEVSANRSRRFHIPFSIGEIPAGRFTITIQTKGDTASRMLVVEARPLIPIGWIKVPQIILADRTEILPFLVMKYEASNKEGKAVSTFGERPWVNVSKGEARVACLMIGGNLINEKQWLAIAQNIANHPDNWSEGIVGQGRLSRGHSDGLPFAALSASSDDTRGCYGTDARLHCTVRETDQKRTFILPNGEIIWDFAGNIQEWTDASVRQQEMPQPTGWLEYNEIRDFGILNYLQLLENWNSLQGIGMLYSIYAMPGIKKYNFARGGDWDSGKKSGVFSLNLSYESGQRNEQIGFRCVK